MDFSETQKKINQKRYTELIVQYEALNQQYDESLDAQEKSIIKSRLEKLELKIQALEKSLEESEKSSLLEKLHYINFKKIINKVQQLLEAFGKQGGSSVLVLQDSAVMAGDLLVMRLQEELRRQSSNFRHLPVGFSGDSELNELGLLRRLSSHLGANSQSIDIDELLEDVIERLCASLQTRSVVFLEITQWHKLPAQDEVFDWICGKFYPRLLLKLADSVRENSWRKVYVFLVIVSEDPLSEKCLQATYPLLPGNEPFGRNGQKNIFEVLLENWSREDIEDWLEFAGLPDEQLESTADRLYRRGRRGLPLIVRDAIEKEFCNV